MAVQRAATRRPTPARHRTCRTGPAPRALRHSQAHDQSELAGHAGRGGFVPDLRQLLGAVQHEVAHAMPGPGLADGAARLDRVHEMDRGVGEHLAHQRHLADRRAVEMRDAAGVDGAQHRAVPDCTSPRTARRPGTPRRIRARSPRRSPDACNASAPRAVRRRRVRRPRAAPSSRQESGGAEGTRPCGRGNCSLRESSQASVRARAARPTTGKG